MPDHDRDTTARPDAAPPGAEQAEVRREDLGLDHEPVAEIIGKEPAWIIRWGITMIFFSTILMLMGTWIIKYPDAVPANIIITTQTPPLTVPARTSGKLEALYVQEGQRVDTGDYLALLENSARIDEINTLRDQLERFRGFLLDPKDYRQDTLEKLVNLGPLQADYADFFDRFADYKDHLDQNFNGQKIIATQGQIDRYRELQRKQQDQRDLQQQELELAQRKLANSEELFKQQMVAETELNDLKTSVLQARYALTAAENTLVNNRIQLGDLERVLLELEQSETAAVRSLVQRAQSSYKTLAGSFADWELTYVLKAPTEGVVSLFQFWSPNQFVTAGAEVLTVVPDQSALVGRIFLPQRGSGKVEVGQDVQIKFASFPFDEFGMVLGEVASISPVAQQDQYLVNVALTNGLKTSYNKELEFKHNMSGSAEIITEDLRLIERIFNQLRSIFKGGLT